MFRQTFLLLCAICLSYSGFSQLNRTIDGSLNNLQNPSWGAANAPLDHITAISFSDGFSSPAGANRANPRIISNSIFAQDQLLNDPLKLSDYVWVFGQFIDHDIVSVSNDPTEDASIPVNFPDEHFNPGGLFQDVDIHMTRSQAIDGTGTGPSNPRKYANSLTAWIDASGVYGSDQTRADWLRTFTGGKLKTSTGNLLPYNTISNEIDGTIDSNAPAMDNENPFIDVLFVAGDARANEQPLLLAFHTIFVREHNRLCDELILEYPTWTDEELYQYARRVVGGLIQAIVYNEWLPAMGVHLPNYSGYLSTTFPNISNIFSAAAFRLGHTLLNSNILLMDNDGNLIESVTLADGFFNTSIVAEHGLDPLFKGIGTQIQQDLDGKVVDDVRNFLFGPPQFGLGGLDLASININRGRERGLADFNTVRSNLGLPKYTSFSEICSDPEVYGELQNLYDNNINNIDAWVGMLVETHMTDALFGETIMKIMEQQFGVLREGDRFFFENDPVLTPVEKAEIRETTFRDIIMRNTGITLMQSNVFEAMPHDSICPTAVGWVDLTGNIQTENGLVVDDVLVTLTNETESTLDDYTTDADGNFIFDALTTCDHFTVQPSYNEDIRNGVNTNDMVKLAKHILAIETLDSPYKIIAADLNNNGNVNLSDLIHMQKVILFVDSSFTNNTPWRFVDANYTFQNPTAPLSETFPEEVDITYLSEQSAITNFVAVKIGDLNEDVNPSGFQSGDTRSEKQLTFYTQEQAIKRGEEYTVEFTTKQLATVNAYQYTLNFNQNALEFVEVIPGALENMSDQNFGLLLNKGAITTNWYGTASDKTHQVFSLRFKARTDGQLSELLSINSRFTASEAYGRDSKLMDVNLQFELEEDVVIPGTVFELYQNQPNPFKQQTVIGFNLPEPGNTSLVIYDLAGRVVKVIDGQFNQGYQEITIDQAELSTSGLLYYQLNSAAGSLTRKMMVH